MHPRAVLRALFSPAAIVVLTGLAISAPPSRGAGLAVERAAPRAQVSLALAWATIDLDYGRASAKGRPVFGNTVPFDRLWRLGSDEATQLHTDAAIALGGIALDPGRYALFAIPHRGTWTLIVNKQAEQWGAWNYDAAQDAGRAELLVEAPPSAVEPLAMTLESTGEKEGVLRIAFENAQVSVPILVTGDPPAPPAPAGGTPSSGLGKPGGKKAPSPPALPPPPP